MSTNAVHHPNHMTDLFNKGSNSSVSAAKTHTSKAASYATSTDRSQKKSFEKYVSKSPSSMKGNASTSKKPLAKDQKNKVSKAASEVEHHTATKTKSKKRFTAEPYHQLETAQDLTSEAINIAAIQPETSSPLENKPFSQINPELLSTAGKILHMLGSADWSTQLSNQVLELKEFVSSNPLLKNLVQAGSKALDVEAPIRDFLKAFETNADASFFKKNQIGVHTQVNFSQFLHMVGIPSSKATEVFEQLNQLTGTPVISEQVTSGVTTTQKLQTPATRGEKISPDSKKQTPRTSSIEQNFASGFNSQDNQVEQASPLEPTSHSKIAEKIIPSVETRPQRAQEKQFPGDKLSHNFNPPQGQDLATQQAPATFNSLNQSPSTHQSGIAKQAGTAPTDSIVEQQNLATIPQEPVISAQKSPSLKPLSTSQSSAINQKQQKILADLRQLEGTSKANLTETELVNTQESDLQIETNRKSQVTKVNQKNHLTPLTEVRANALESLSNQQSLNSEGFLSDQREQPEFSSESPQLSSQPQAAQVSSKFDLSAIRDVVGNSAPTKPAEIWQKVSEFAAELQSNGGGSANWTMKDTSFGSLGMQLQVNEGNVHLKLQSSSEKIQQAMQGDLQHLSDSLAQSQLRLADVEFSKNPQTDLFSQSTWGEHPEAFYHQNKQQNSSHDFANRQSQNQNPWGLKQPSLADETSQQHIAQLETQKHIALHV